jgi:hypothetical protein
MRPIVEKVMPYDAADTLYLEDFLDVNESMDVFGDRQDLDLRPPPGAPGTRKPEPHRETVQMTAKQFRNMI